MTARLPALDAMAKVLSEVAIEIRNKLECRAVLAFANFTDEQIDRYLAEAQFIALNMRTAEIERRAQSQWK
jgi:hypothetical protein